MSATDQRVLPKARRDARSHIVTLRRLGYALLAIRVVILVSLGMVLWTFYGAFQLTYHWLSASSVLVFTLIYMALSGALRAILKVPGWRDPLGRLGVFRSLDIPPVDYLLVWIGFRPIA